MPSSIAPDGAGDDAGDGSLAPLAQVAGGGTATQGTTTGLRVDERLLTSDGLSPYWRLTDGINTALTGYGWTQTGVYGVGFGTLKYNILYTPPLNVYSWTLEVCETLSGSTPSGLTSAPINVPAPQPQFNVNLSAPPNFEVVLGGG